jgi:hypothetical protein
VFLARELSENEMCFVFWIRIPSLTWLRVNSNKDQLISPYLVGLFMADLPGFLRQQTIGTRGLPLHLAYLSLCSPFIFSWKNTE